MPLPAEKLETTDNDVPQRLIETATALYGARGTHAVSVREVMRKAAVLNEAAVRYYFKNKQGLLVACVEQVATQMEEAAAECWDEFLSKKAAGDIQIADVVETFCFPFIAVYLENEQGAALVARLIREEGEQGQDLILDKFGPFIWRAEAELAKLLPNKSSRALRLHLFLAINNITNGMVDQSLLWRLPSTEGGDAHFRLSAEELTKGFMEYVAAGIATDSEIK